MATPATAAAWASAASEACGLASQPNTSACTKAAPVSFERRCTKPVARAAAASAVVVNRVCKVWASCGTVVIRRLLRCYKVVHILIVPKEPSYVFVTLMRIGTGDGTRRLVDGERVRVDGTRGLVLGAAPRTTGHDGEEQPG